jgi:large subunit ribosomal protein L10
LSLNRSEKEAVISEVTSLAAKAQTLVIAEYRGITVADMTKLRNDARSNGVSLSVLKNTLARRAVAGSAFEVVVRPDDRSFDLWLFRRRSGRRQGGGRLRENQRQVGDSGRRVRRQGPGRERREAIGQHPSKEVLLAQLCGLDACPPFPVRPRAGRLWRRKKARVLPPKQLPRKRRSLS